MVKSGSVYVATGKNVKSGKLCGRSPGFTRLQRNRVNVYTAYTGSLDYYRFIRYNEIHADGNAVAIASDQQKY